MTVDYRGKWLFEPQHILFEVSDNVATVTLNRPEKRNALGLTLLQEMHDALMEADDRNDVNCVLLAGAGKDFCAGYDLEGHYAGKAAAAGALGDPDRPPVSYRSVVNCHDDDIWNLEQSQKLTNIIFDMHKPVIAKVQGNCLAGGTDLALACDMVVVAEDARIGFPATRANGSPPSNMWIYHVGPQWAKRMLMTGDKMTGADAVKIGLALDCVPAERLDEEAMALARRVGAIDSELLSAHKRVVNLALEQMGAKTMQRLAAETDARAHLSKGPRRTQFKSDMAEHGMKVALTNRDAPFGDGFVRVRGR